MNKPLPNPTVKRFDSYKKNLLQIIKDELPGCRVYIFGSRARGDYKQGSDIDLALDLGVKIDSNKIYAIKDRIEESTIPLHVDLVDINAVSEKFREKIEIT